MIFGETLSTGVIRDLLAFESEKYGIPFYVSVMDLNEYNESFAIRKALEVYIHTGSGITKEILYKDTPITISNVHLPYTANPSQDATYGTFHNRIFIGFDIETYKDEPWINGLFSSIFDKVMPEIKKFMDNDIDTAWKQEYLSVKRSIVKQQVKTMKSDIDSNGEEIDDKTNEIKELITKNYTLAQAIQSIVNVPEGIAKKAALSEFDALMKLTPQPISNIELDADDGRITVYTDDISIDHDDIDYYIGKFKIDIYPVKSEIKFTNLVKKVQGYHHPHISQAGIPCLGNISSTVYYLLVHQEIYQLITLLIEFLKSYNEDNPYKTIDHWDPEYDEDRNARERYDSCYEDVSPYECVSCGDTDCPYYDDAQDRCHETRDSIDECVQCTQDCRYARDYTGCFHSQNDNHPDCRTCTIAACPHNQRVPARA